MTFVVAGSGHRPNKLAPASLCYSSKVRDRLTDLARAYLIRTAPSAVISGMALGWDTALALAAIDLNIPLTAAVPFLGQESRWHSSDQKLFHEILDSAHKVHIVSPGSYSPTKMQVRNQWMTDNCNCLVILWDGSTGGTGNCVSYARSLDIQCDNLWNSWVKYRGF